MKNSEIECVEKILESRFSCRSFSNRTVDKQQIVRLLEASQKTPSWCNSQAWQVELLSGSKLKELIDSLYAAAASDTPPNPDFTFPEKYVGVYRDRRKVCGVQLYTALGIGRDDREAARSQALENFRAFSAPHVAIITSERELGIYGAVDCGLYIANFLIAAQALGINTIAQAALASYPTIVRKSLGISSDRWLVAGIAFGYGNLEESINLYRTERAKIEDVVNWWD